MSGEHLLAATSSLISKYPIKEWWHRICYSGKQAPYLPVIIDIKSNWITLSHPTEFYQPISHMKILPTIETSSIPSTIETHTILIQINCMVRQLAILEAVWTRCQGVTKLSLATARIRYNACTIQWTPMNSNQYVKTKLGIKISQPLHQLTSLRCMYLPQDRYHYQEDPFK